MMFDLGHALERLTSQHRSLQCLIAFAHSPRLETVLQLQLSIISVPSQPKRPVVLVQLSDHWKAIIQTIVPPEKSIGGKWIQKETTSLIKDLGKHPKWDAPVHCECALIEYYWQSLRSAGSINLHPRRDNLSTAPLGHRYQENKQPEKGKEWKVVGRKEGSTMSAKISHEWKLVPPFSYIGISKLSCSTCQIWIEGYNEKVGPGFYTRGCHGKWYFPWAIPRLQECELGPYMVNQITKIYYEHCGAKRRIRTLSDGSNSGMAYLRTPSKRWTQGVASTFLDSMKL